MWHQKTYFFVVLCVLNAATNWDLTGEIFKERGPALQRLFSCRVNILNSLLYQDCVNHY